MLQLFLFWIFSYLVSTQDLGPFDYISDIQLQYSKAYVEQYILQPNMYINPYVSTVPVSFRHVRNQYLNEELWVMLHDVYYVPSKTVQFSGPYSYVVAILTNGTKASIAYGHQYAFNKIASEFIHSVDPLGNHILSIVSGNTYTIRLEYQILDDRCPLNSNTDRDMSRDFFVSSYQNRTQCFEKEHNMLRYSTNNRVIGTIHIMEGGLLGPEGRTEPFRNGCRDTMVVSNWKKELYTPGDHPCSLFKPVEGVIFDATSDDWFCPSFCTGASSCYNDQVCSFFDNSTKWTDSIFKGCNAAIPCASCFPFNRCTAIMQNTQTKCQTCLSKYSNVLNKVMQNCKLSWSLQGQYRPRACDRIDRIITRFIPKCRAICLKEP